MSKYNSSKAYGSAIGPFGFPMPDKLAKAADEALQAVPKDVREKFKTTVRDAAGQKHAVEGYMRLETVAKAMDFVDGERSDVSVITSDSVDRDSEVVLPSGLDFTQFQRNPVVTLCHNYQAFPVGKCLWVKKGTMGNGGDCWKAKTQYMPRPAEFPVDEEWLPDTTWAYVRDGYLPGKSIGFIPLSFRDVTPDDVRANPDYADAHWIIDHAIVLEYAVVPVQANPDALVEAVAKMKAKGIVSKGLTDALGIVIPDAMPNADQIEATAILKDIDDGLKKVVKKTEPVIIKTIINAESVQKAATRQAMAALSGMEKKVSDQLMDRIYQKMGKV